MNLLPSPKVLHLESDAPAGKPEIVSESISGHLGPQAYEMEIGQGGTRITGGDSAGLFYAKCTLKQIVRNAGQRGVPSLKVSDAPEFLNRGFMLDISRGKVPTMASLFELIELLAELKINQLQLYTEHTFAYSGHEIVWGDASPLTASEIRELDAFCRERFIELVPNQNSFGHMERWLRHPEYQHLAECPKGFVHPLSGERKFAGSVLAPGEPSLEFLNGLYDELLPCFSSRQFNIGFDEPWELGEGKSQEAVEISGKEEVYLRFLGQIYDLVHRHGRSVQFWADIILERPDQLFRLPDGALPIIWGYEADHPFHTQCAALEQTGLRYYVAPGTSTWNSFGGRLGTAYENLENASRHAMSYRANGILITSWGDNGNHQAWASLYPPLLHGAALAWAGHNHRPFITEHINRFLFGNRNEALAQVMVEAGEIDSWISLSLRNFSPYHKLFFATASELNKILITLDAKQLLAANERITDLESRTISIQTSSDVEAHAKAEIALALKMARWAVRRASYALNQKPSEGLRHDLKVIIGEFEQTWLLRARVGGLMEASHRLRSQFAEI